MPAPAAQPPCTAAVKAPVPAPSSTTTGSPRSGTPTTICAASRGELGSTAAVRRGDLMNSRRNRPPPGAWRRWSVVKVLPPVRSAAALRFSRRGDGGRMAGK
ncbi:hypothetical protein ACFQ0B_53105 [Nonomuraea thailandensis]